MKAVFSAMNAKDFESCLNQVDVYLDTDFVSIPAHFSAMLCHAGLKNEKESNFHRYVLDGLMHSIVSDGDGKSEMSAFTTISIEEARTFLQLTDFEIESAAIFESALEGGEKKNFEVYDVVSLETRIKSKLYFDISIQVSEGFK
jgi:hypothetical protein